MTELPEFKSVEDILDFAIEREAQAAQFYADMADKVDKPWAKKIFQQFAHEERGHKAKLQAVKMGKRMLTSAKKVSDLKIGDYLAPVQVSDEMTYQQVLTVAMHREKAAFRLYQDLADRIDEEEVKSLFQGLAQEEAKHKLRFELEYDKAILRDN